MRNINRMTELAQSAIRMGLKLEEAAEEMGDGEALDYPALLAAGEVIVPLDHADAAHCFVTGTGLTHLGSAAARDEMHRKAAAETGNESDSIKMFNLGLKGGKPKGGPGVQPEWFYKGDGSMLVRPGGDLPLPEHALDGGEEPEVVGLYVIGSDRQPWRLGFTIGNEFSDHVLERQNYLYLAHSKLRACSIGPELRTGALPDHVSGESRIIRDGKVLWQKAFVSGEANMSHAIANLEYHHFKYDLFRRPGDVHIHFFGTATLSISDGVRTMPDDVFEIEVEEFGKLLRNRMVASKSAFGYGETGQL
ncbi:MAG: AraD1 family protein [Aestuariivirgaceae bacterium]